MRISALHNLKSAFKKYALIAGRFLVKAGLPASYFNYRIIPEETPEQYRERVQKKSNENPSFSYRKIHSVSRENNPLPRNIENKKELPSDQGWWGYSFRDVPARRSGETALYKIPNAKIIPWIHPDTNEFWPAILNEDGYALKLREIKLQSEHKEILKSSNEFQHYDKGTWIYERVYRNHSHWLSAHLPKLIYLKERNLLEDLLIPIQKYRTPVMDDSFQYLGINPDSFKTFNPEKPLFFNQLTIFETDRFRPELLKFVQSAFSKHNTTVSDRNIYISRDKASRRQLVNETEIFNYLKTYGYEKVFLEELSFKDQVQLMQEAENIIAPHGAGLTNMIFCQPGTNIVEIADLSFPNPNFYAMAAALEHNYWLAEATGLGDGHPLERDMVIQLEKIKRIVKEIHTNEN